MTMSASPETSTSLDVNFELPSMSSQLNTDSEIDSSLAHEPSIIRGKGGERLWHVPAIKEMANFCKMQLKVTSQ